MLNWMSPVDPVPMPSASGQIKPTPGTYHGFTVRNTSASAVATIRIWDNLNAASGTLLDTVQLQASESAREWYERGERSMIGVYFEIVAGAVEGSIRVGS